MKYSSVQLPLPLPLPSKQRSSSSTSCMSSMSLVLVLLLTLPMTMDAQGLFSRLAGGFGGKNKKDGDKGTGGLSDVVSTTLSQEGVELPLVGLGVGNMVPHFIPAMVSHALRDDKRIRLIDTSNVSQSEHLVAQGIVEGAEYVMERRRGTGNGGEENDELTPLEVHVITKVWYTHLGYERTQYAVQESLKALSPALEHPQIDLKVHVLLQWPRCYDAIPWMHCAEEEAALPANVQAMGKLPPHQDKTHSMWKESWKALETFVQEESSPVVSIGVSNFNLNDLETLWNEVATTVKPSIVEANLWSLLYDPQLVQFCHVHQIHIVAFSILEQSLRGASTRTDFAAHHLLTLAHQLTKTMQEQGKHFVNQDNHLTPVQVVLAWLIQHSITIVPRTTDLQHLKENSAVALGEIPFMTNEQTQTVATAVEAIMTGDDLPTDSGIEVTFHAKSQPVWLYWRDDADGWEQLIAVIPQGETFVDISHPGHKFLAYDSQDKAGTVQTLHVPGNYGDTHHVEL